MATPSLPLEFTGGRAFMSQSFVFRRKIIQNIYLMGKQILRRNTNHCDINARPPVNSNGKEGVAMKQSRSSDRSFQVQHKSDFDFHRWIIDENVCISTKYRSIFEERHLIYMLTTFFWEWNYLSGRIFYSKCSRRRIDGRESAAFYLLYVHKWLVATIDCKAFKKYYNSKITTKELHTIK